MARHLTDLNLEESHRGAFVNAIEKSRSTLLLTCKQENNKTTRVDILLTQIPYLLQIPWSYSRHSVAP